MAIPTVYRGVQFRSRLEAKWACMFDWLDLQWEYEPLDLEGYIPDFMLWVDRWNSPFLVEIKPLIEIFDYPDDDPLVVAARDKWQVTSSDRPLLILGAVLQPLPPDTSTEPGGGSHRVGYLYHEPTYYSHIDLVKEPNRLMILTEPNNIHRQIDRKFVQKTWNDAGNVTQWKGVQNELF